MKKGLAVPSYFKQVSPVNQPQPKANNMNIPKTPVEKSVAQMAICENIKNGTTENLLSALGDCWGNAPDNIHKISRSISKACFEIQELRGMIRSACEEIQEEGANEDQREILAKGILEAAKTQILWEIEQTISMIYTSRKF